MNAKKHGQSILCEGMKDYGLREVYGGQSNPIILQMIQEQLPWVGDDSKAAWCGLWLGKVFDRLGFQKPKKWWGAQMWTRVGSKVRIEDIQQGDLVVFWRESPSSWKGHVAIFTGQIDDVHIWVLGANQQNKVGVSAYDLSRIINIRRCNG